MSATKLNLRRRLAVITAVAVSLLVSLVVSASATSTMNTVIETVTVGSAPQGIAISTDGAFAYVANTSSQTVSKVDLGASPAAVIATIQVGTSPVGVVVTPDGTRVYVTNFGSNDVSVINTSSNTVIATTPVGPSPVGVAVTPDGTHVFVTNSGSNTVSVIDTSSNAVSTTIVVGTAPKGIAISPDGLYALVANYVGNSVSLITLSNNSVQDFVSQWGPTSIAIDATSHYAYVTYDDVTNGFSGGAPGFGIFLLAAPVGLQGFQAFLQTPFAGAGIALDPSGALGYITNESDNSVTVFNMISGAILSTTIPVGSAPIGIALNPSGARAYVTNSGGSTVSVLDIVVPDPIITSVTPASGYENGGYTIVIAGTGFDSITSVTLGGTACPITVQSQTSITCSVPSHATGVVDVTVSGFSKTNTLSASFTFLATTTTSTTSVTTTSSTTSTSSTSTTSVTGDSSVTTVADDPITPAFTG